MPATDILNPTTTWDETIEDSMTPNYGFTRKRVSTKLNKKAVGGTPWTRETQNTGHVFNFSWLGRSWPCVRELKRYWEQYEDGLFTIIDQDGGGRHYVGRFTTEVIPVETGNGMWDVQNVTFEEISQQAMVEYPSDWTDDAIAFFIINDFGDQKLATNSSTNAWVQTARESVTGSQGTEHVSLATVGTAYVTMDNPATVAGDWACYEYRGYGFRLYMLKGPEFGNVDLYIDGVLQETICLWNATDIGPQIVATYQSMPLDIHRVQINCDGTFYTIPPVVHTAPVLASLAGTLTVAAAADVLGGTLAGVQGDGVTAYSITLGTSGTTDTLTNLLHAINVTHAAYGITATLNGPGTQMTFAATGGDTGAPTMVGAGLSDTTPGIPQGTAVSWYALEVMR